MTNILLISAADSLLSILYQVTQSRLLSVVAPNSPRADALLAFLIGSLLIAGSLIARALVSLIRRNEGHIAGRAGAAPFAAADATAGSPSSSRTDAA